MKIRTCQPDDAAAFLDLLRRLDNETQFMMLEPDERATTLDEQQARLERLTLSEDERVFLALDGDRAVGYVAGSRQPFRRARHVLYLVIGVARSHWGQGVGRKLLAVVESWAAAVGATRLELTVIANNERAVALYHRCGFETEGVRRNAMLVDGAYVDELYMAKLLPTNGRDVVSTSP
jgi:RimJ/RimL family protein N-acetyltransferase